MEPSPKIAELVSDTRLDEVAKLALAGGSYRAILRELVLDPLVEEISKGEGEVRRLKIEIATGYMIDRGDDMAGISEEDLLFYYEHRLARIKRNLGATSK